VSEAPNTKKRVVVLCTGNSCRSQMAEGFWRHYAGEVWDVTSAGLTPIGVNRLAVKAMAEVGIDIAGHASKALDGFLDQPFDLVITVCANADRACPTFPNARAKEHWPFDDPARAGGREEAQMREFRRVRDGIAAKIQEWLGTAW
jgi:arsenate reductase